MKVCYTVNIGGYDQLKNPEVITEGWKYLCITDNPEVCEGTVYEPVIHRILPNENRELISKRYKWQYWSSFKEISIYHDANFQIKGNLDEFIEPYQDCKLVTRPHSHRTNVAQEIKALRNSGKLNIDLSKLDEYSKKLGWIPEKLYENGVLIFNESVQQHHLLLASITVSSALAPGFSRDQIILPIVAEKMQLEVTTMPRQHVSNFFNYNPKHLK